MLDLHAIGLGVKLHRDIKVGHRDADVIDAEEQVLGDQGVHDCIVSHAL